MNAKTYPMNKKQTGFTLIELMVTLAIAAILIAVAAPNFSTMTQNNRISSQTNLIIAAFTFARSEAVKRSATINVTATNAIASDEWGAGWTVSVDGGADLKIFPALEGSSTLDSTGNISAFQYLPIGRASVTDTFDLCDGRTGEVGRQLTILPTGRIALTNSNLNCS